MKRFLKKQKFSKTFPSQILFKVLTNLEPWCPNKNHIFTSMKGVYANKKKCSTFLNDEGGCDKVSQEARVLKNFCKAV